MKNITFLFVFLILSIFTRTEAQELLGNSGGMNIPTAEMMPAGTFRTGINYIGKGIITGEKNASDHRWQFNYNTYNYYLNFTFFDWLEATFRETLLESNSYGKYNDYKLFREQDRSISVKARVIKESNLMPAIAICIHDPYSFSGHHTFSSVWIAATKQIHSKLLASTCTTTVGYSQPFDKSQFQDGIFAGIKYTPDFLPQSSVIAEYDTKGFNLGLQALLFNHVGLYCFSHDFETFSAGIKYQTLIHF